LKHTIIARTCRSRNGRSGWRHVSLLLIMLALLVQPGAQSGDAAAAPLAQLSSISGTVTMNGSGVDDAVVVATRSNLARPAPTDATGAYSLTALPADDYTLSVRPISVTTTSPDWVYAADPLVVSVPPAATQDFTVQAASVTVAGQLLSPTGSDATFDAPNRAWVRVENQEGQGNSVQVAGDGSFTVKLLPGVVLLSLTLENPDWAAPLTLRSMVYHAEAGETIDVGALQVMEKQAGINGTVRLVDGTASAGGSAPAGIPVRAWRLDGTEYEQTRTDEQGQYQLQVIEGVWLVRAIPLEEQPYLPAEPPQRIFLDSPDATVTQDLLIAEADVTLSGITVDSVTGEPLTDGVDGRAYAFYPQEDQRHPTRSASAQLSDGAFTLKLASSLSEVYTIGVAFPPDVAYTALSRVTVNLNTTIVEPIQIPITPNDAHIRGALKDRDGANVTAVPGSVWAAGDSGGWARTRVNPVDGTYDLAVSTTDVTGTGGSTWRVHAFVDPTSGYLVQRPRMQRVFLPFNDGAGSTVEDVDFTLVSLASLGTLRGTVTAPDGTPLRGVRVVVSEVTDAGSTAVNRWDYTNRQGNYQVQVPAGSYRVQVHFRRLQNQRGSLPAHLLPPTPVTVSLAEQGDVTVDLRFRESDATVSGQVMFDGAGHAGLVRARSADGITVHAPAGPDGNFRLHLLSGVSWTLQAVSSEGDMFLRSAPLAVTPAAGSNSLDAPLLLAEAMPIPESQAFVFQADADQFFTMSDGSEVRVPAGAMAISGTVALTVRPLPELEAAGDLQPVSFGYRLHAFAGGETSRRQPVTHFMRPVTLVIPFTAAQLADLGIEMDQLVPAYWDEASGSWKPVENVAVVPDADGGGTVQIAVDHFTDFALLAASGNNRVFLPMVQR